MKVHDNKSLLEDAFFVTNCKCNLNYMLKELYKGNIDSRNKKRCK